MLSIFRRSSPIDEFWIWFSENASRFESQEALAELPFKELSKRLNRIDKGLVFEVGQATPHQLTISADGIPELIPTVRKVVEAAPQIEGWTVLAFRQPLTEPVQIEFQDHTLTIDDIFFAVRKMDKVADLDIYVDGLHEQNYKHLAHCTFLLMDSLVGEYAVMTCLGELEFLPLSEATDIEKHPLSKLPELLRDVERDV